MIVMDRGKAVMQGTPREIFSQVDKLKELRLDVPGYYAGTCIKEKRVPLPDGILSAQGAGKGTGILRKESHVDYSGPCESYIYEKRYGDGRIRPSGCVPDDS